MQTMSKVSKSIRKARRKGFSYDLISKDLGISKPAVRRVEQGHYPSKENAERLGIPVRCTTCKRKFPKPKSPRVKPPRIGRDAGWIEYCTRKVKK